MTTQLALRHQRVQRLRRLLRRRSVRRAEGVFVMEGTKLLGSALDGGAGLESVFVAAGSAGSPALAELLERSLAAGARVFELAPGVLERVAETVTPQPVMAVVRMPETGIADLGAASFIVVCAEVRDPGNTGAVIRAADAAGAGAVVCCAGTADPYNPKTVRASAGSVLHLPVIVGGTPQEVLEELGRRGVRRLAAVAIGGTLHTEVDLISPVALVLGNEASGLPESLDGVIDERVTISMGGRAESLNVSTAAAVLCFEVRRRRSNLHAMDDAR
ncbi:MAG: TrmH family RNA methyltransferase [Acidimicrobiales bacterium]